MIQRFQVVMRSHCKQSRSEKDLSNTHFPLYLFFRRITALYSVALTFHGGCKSCGESLLVRQISRLQ